MIDVRSALLAWRSSTDDDILAQSMMVFSDEDGEATLSLPPSQSNDDG